MSRFFFSIFLFLLVAAKVEPRGLHSDFLGQEPALISDGVHEHVDDGYPLLSIDDNVGNMSNDACIHVYGFLPCAYNIGGYAFQIVVFQYLLLTGEYLMSEARVQLSIIFGESIAAFLRLLVMMPRVALIIVSGMSGSKEAAQSMVLNGVGITAGCAIFGLTVQWGLCFFFGSTKITDDIKVPDLAGRSNFRKLLSSVFNSGVKVEPGITKKAARVMLLSLLPFLMVQISELFDSSSWKNGVVLTTLVATALALFSFLGYQFYEALGKKTSLSYSKIEYLLDHFLARVEKNGEGKLVNVSPIIRVFQTIDKNGDGSISNSELQELLADINSRLPPSHKWLTSKDLSKVFPFDDQQNISEQNFVEGFLKLINIAYQTDKEESLSNAKIDEVVDKWMEGRKGVDDIPLIMCGVFKDHKIILRQGLAGRKVDDNTVARIFEKYDANKDGYIELEELKNVMRDFELGILEDNIDVAARKLMKEFDKDHPDKITMEEFSKGIRKWLNKLFFLEIFKASSQIAMGAVIIIFLGRPLMMNIQLLSISVGIPSFFISFLVIPLAINLRQALAARLAACQKEKRMTSRAFEEIYHGVTMSNILSLSVLLAIIYGRGLTWDYSAEVLVVSIIGMIMGILAFRRSTFPLWTCILAILLYPFSLVLVYLLVRFLNWN